MAKERILVSWIGFADLKALSLNISDDKKELIRKQKIELNQGTIEPDGPIKTLLNHEKFHAVFLLNNFGPQIGDLFQDFVGGKSKLFNIKLDTPTDYEKVFTVANATLKDIIKNHPIDKTELCIHLSPGTPTMAAIWVLLGKTIFPATFFQTHKGKVIPTKIPFDITADFLPLLMKNSDIAFQHLADLRPEEIEGFEKITGNSHPIRIVAGRAKRAAMRDVPVLLAGESGTGKELFARAIHNASHRKNKPFKPINCAAIPSQLLESELFGHKKGAFTGADKDRKGLFAEANGGTLFFDEIGECPLEIQAKLLRVLQPTEEKGPCHCAFAPLGSSKEEYSDVRIIAATNRDLIEEIRDKRFREDLYYRLAVITINLPSLRDRADDILNLAEMHLGKLNRAFKVQESGYRDKIFSESTKIFMKNYPWPGNVRQLNNAILQAAVMSEGEKIEKHDIEAAIASTTTIRQAEPFDLRIPDEGFDLEENLNSLRKQYLKQAMKISAGNKTKAARLLGMKTYQTLDAQLKRLAVDWER
jgi:transcriptional regulator with PAS, ATPase and Fis domain